MASSKGNRVRRKLLLSASVVGIVAVVLVVVISPTLYRGETPGSPTSNTVKQTGQCVRADPEAKYPLLLQIWNSAGDPVSEGWIILYDPDRGIPFEEGYSAKNGTYRTKHAYSPLWNMTVLINDFVISQNYDVTVLVPDVVCADGYIHIQVRAS